MTCDHDERDLFGSFRKNLHPDGEQFRLEVKCLDCNSKCFEYHSFDNRWFEIDDDNEDQKCEHENYDSVGKFPKSMEYEDGKLSGKIKCLDCKEIGYEFFQLDSFEEIEK